MERIRKRPVRIIIAGSRGFESYPILNKFMNDNLKELQETLPEIDFSINNLEVVSGGARGADSLGEIWATKHKIRCKRFLPNWDLHGKRAGFIRNKNMILYATTEDEYTEPFGILVAFWDGESKGTENTIMEAQKKLMLCLIRDVRIKKGNESHGKRNVFTNN